MAIASISPLTALPPTLQWPAWVRTIIIGSARYLTNQIDPDQASSPSDGPVGYDTAKSILVKRVLVLRTST